ncbi:MAG: Fis family transcriptional regulator [Phormidesmis priestleyi]|uniref:Fis family transcriptional regulator n=1 Tax=Phormidesmis priestleyi TaxID=268141 RepID=A0A2W4ZH45_9CYAN|nr:MAG: Fis family transcriptional regulator [Phormidesmis priestleyi]
MKVRLSVLRLVPLAMLLCGMLPVKVGAAVLQQAFREPVVLFDGLDVSVEKRVQERELDPSMRFQGNQAREMQTRRGKQADSDVLLSVEGALAESDSQLDDESLYDVHLFEGQAGQIVRIGLTSNEFDTLLLLQDAYKIELISNDDSSEETTNSEVVFRLPTAGQYRILASAYDASGRGDYQLIVTDADEQALLQAELIAEGENLFQQGNESFRTSQYRTALEAWQSALKIYRELGDRRREAGLLSNLGSAYWSLGDYQQAIDLHHRSLSIARQISYRRGEAASLSNLGNTYYSLGNYQQAADFHQQSIVIEQEIGNRDGEVISMVALGADYWSLGNYQRAIEIHQESLNLARELDYRLAEAASLTNLGNTYNSIGNYQKAIDFYRGSFLISQEIGDRNGEAFTLNNLGMANDNLENYSAAVDFYQESLHIFRNIGDRNGEVNSLNNLANSYSSLREYQKAIDLCLQAISLADNIEYSAGKAYSLNNLGNIYRILGDYKEAISFHQKSLEISREISEIQGELNALNSIGFAYLEQGSYAAAEESLNDAISIYEGSVFYELPDSERISLFETHLKTYEYLELAMVSQNRYSEALLVSERGRTRSLSRLVSERSSEKFGVQTSFEPFDLIEVQRVAKEQQSVLVEYSLIATVDDSLLLHIWVVQPTGELHFKEVSIDNSLEGVIELIRQSRETIGLRSRGGLEHTVHISQKRDLSAQLSQLHQLLIEPVADWLPTDPNQQITFIPQGELFLVPFAALKNESGTYLVERHTVSTAPSIQVLDLTRRRSTTTANRSDDIANILTVGNPVMPEVWNPDSDTFTQLSSLVGAEQEAKAIANFFGTEALIGAQATEQAVKQQIGNARIVHLATHGLLEYGIPEESGVKDVPGAIALTPTETEDGLLTATEIIEELDLQADLVVLSACDTGLGRVTGDGVIGLSRSLIAAGATSVIVSLWSIPDAPTAELMVEFYRQRQQGKDKAQALRQAMLTTMETHPNPRDWAAFTLIGEAN